MHTRKLQTVGGGTYTVSLPKEWVQSQGLDAGDPVDLHQRADETLMLQTGKRESDSPEDVVFHELPDTSDGRSGAIRAAYNAGASEIRLPESETDASTRRREIDQAVRPLAGVSVVETDRTISLQALLDTEEVSVPQAIRQLTFVTLASQQDASDALTDGTTPTPPTAHRRQPRRLRAMVERAFATALDRLDDLASLGLSRSALFELRETARHLEAVTEGMDRITTHAAEAGDSLGAQTRRELTALLGTARDLLERAVAVVLGDDGVDVALEAMDTAATIRKEAREFDDRLADSDHSGCGRLVADEIRRIADAGGGIAQLGLRKAIREGRLSGRERSEA